VSSPLPPPDPPAPRHAPAAPASALADLGVRVASGAGLAAVALGLLYAGAKPFTLLVLAAALAMCWEWGHIVRAPGRGGGHAPGVDVILLVHAATVAGAILLAMLGYAAPALIALIAGTLVIAALRFGERARLSALGVLYVGLPAIALIVLRSNEPYGFAAVLFVVAAVVATDTLAYFCGRAIGGPKLWPRVSPKKTWSGFLGGVASAGVVGAITGALITGGQPLRLALIGLLLGIVAQGGDLAESALKRHFDVKDASAILPGHGGVMDRMDGLVAAALVAMLIGLAGSMYAPARALLLGF
jgi:phosphatidate cytidylyltransferase